MQTRAGPLDAIDTTGLTTTADTAAACANTTTAARNDAEAMQTKAYTTGYHDKAHQLGVVIERLAEAETTLTAVAQRAHEINQDLTNTQTVLEDAHTQTETLAGD